jgi:hypothetical protein
MSYLIPGKQLTMNLNIKKTDTLYIEAEAQEKGNFQTVTF